MKNIHFIKTNNPSRLYKAVGRLKLRDSIDDTDVSLGLISNQYVYITSDEKIKKGDSVILPSGTMLKNIRELEIEEYLEKGIHIKKIVLSTEQDLIDNGVQEIDNEFLQWFVKNQSCDKVEIDKGYRGVDLYNYKIIIPKEEHKQTAQEYEQQGLEKYSYELKQETQAYKLISEYYKDKTAKRSGVKLMNHIDEGIEILKSIGANQDTIDAYCLHPILQSDEAFNENYNKIDFSNIPISALLLAMEYRRVANSYLSKDKLEDFVGFTNEKIKQMLYADKIQNEKDFTLYHEGKHERSKELREYFNNWINILLK